MMTRNRAIEPDAPTTPDEPASPREIATPREESRVRPKTAARELPDNDNPSSAASDSASGKIFVTPGPTTPEGLDRDLRMFQQLAGEKGNASAGVACVRLRAQLHGWLGRATAPSCHPERSEGSMMMTVDPSAAPRDDTVPPDDAGPPDDTPLASTTLATSTWATQGLYDPDEPCPVDCAADAWQMRTAYTNLTSLLSQPHERAVYPTGPPTIAVTWQKWRYADAPDEPSQAVPPAASFAVGMTRLSPSYAE